MGTLHGGVLCDIADAAMARPISAPWPGESLTTIELKINFVRPVWKAKLRADAKVARAGRVVGLIECDIFDDRKRMGASIRTCMRLRGQLAEGRQQRKRYSLSDPKRLLSISITFETIRYVEITMSGRLEGKVAVITGGNSGIGLATAKRFVAEGAYVFITGRRQAELDAAVKEIGKNVTGVQGDVSNLADLDRLYATVKEKKGRIDVLFANAGAGEFAAAGSDHRGALRQDLRHQRQGPALHGAEGAAAVPDGGSIILNASIVSSRGCRRSASTARPRPRCGRSPAPGRST